MDTEFTIWAIRFNWQPKMSLNVELLSCRKCCSNEAAEFNYLHEKS